MRIGIDLMGGDTPPHNLFPAVLQAAETLDNTHSFLIIATQIVADQLLPLISPTKRPAIEFHVVADSIAMAEEPLGAVRKKKGASLVVGVRLLKKGVISALVSCGNTGALIAAAAFALPMLPGVEKPGLLALLPTSQGKVAVLDVGGTVSTKARHLIQFAHFGAAYQKIAQGIEMPKVGLLNIGIESKKGTQEIRQTYETLRAESEQISNRSQQMHFVGNIEARDVFAGGIDVLVTDGFTGNVLLKAAEGVASFIFSSLSQAAAQTNAVPLKELLNKTQKQFNYTEYPGALICGIDGIIVKAHGNSSSKAFLYSILEASQLVAKNIIPSIKAQLK